MPVKVRVLPPLAEKTWEPLTVNCVILAEELRLRVVLLEPSTAMMQVPKS